MAQSIRVKTTITVLDRKNMRSSFQFTVKGTLIYSGGGVQLVTSNTAFGGVTGDWLGELNEYYQFALQLIDEVINGSIVGMSHAIDAPLPSGIKQTPETNADAEEKLLLIGTYPPTWRMSIPTINHEIPFDDPALLLLYSHLTGNGESWGAGYGGITDNRGDAIFDYRYERQFKPRKRK